MDNARSLGVRTNIHCSRASMMKNVFSPHMGTSVSLVPGLLDLRKNCNVTTGVPSLLCLCPRGTCFRCVGVGRLAGRGVPRDRHLFVAAARIQRMSGSSLGVTRGRGTRINFGLQINGAGLGMVTCGRHLGSNCMVDRAFGAFGAFVCGRCRHARGKVRLDDDLPMLSACTGPAGGLGVRAGNLRFSLGVKHVSTVHATFRVGNS